MKKFLVSGFTLMTLIVSAQQIPLSQQVAATVMNTWKDSFALGNRARWS